MTECRVEQRLTAEHTAVVLQTRPLVLHVATVPASEETTDKWLVDIVLHEDADGVPAALATEIGRLDLTIRDVSPQGGFWCALLAV